jgi:uncharacterized protein YbgA (DUF1722 family)/uncharacterized protein YbbK (DUF523 family)
MTLAVRPRVGVSSCLLGEEVRFDGGHKRFRFLTDELGLYVDWVPYCPEMEIGLGAPREPIRLTADGRLVNRSGTADHTVAMASLPVPAGLDGYVFKAKSPSCGIFGIPRYGSDGSVADRRGRGLYAGRVLAEDPLLAAEEEGRLSDPGLREAFVERVFAAARLRVLLGGSWGLTDLADFHARHKLQLLAHDPGRYRAAGRVVAAAGAEGSGPRSPGTGSGPRSPGTGSGPRSPATGSGPRSPATGSGLRSSAAADGGGPRLSAAAEYRELFLAALAEPATRGRNANALLHAYSRIGRSLEQPRRLDLVGRIEAYRRGEVPLGVPVALLAHYAAGGDLPWLAEQTYLAPFPAGLQLRHAV